MSAKCDGDTYNDRRLRSRPILHRKSAADLHPNNQLERWRAEEELLAHDYNGENIVRSQGGKEKRSRIGTTTAPATLVLKRYLFGNRPSLSEGQSDRREWTYAAGPDKAAAHSKQAMSLGHRSRITERRIASKMHQNNRDVRGLIQMQCI